MLNVLSKMSPDITWNILRTNETQISEKQPEYLRLMSSRLISNEIYPIMHSRIVQQKSIITNLELSMHNNITIFNYASPHLFQKNQLKKLLNLPHASSTAHLGP